MSRWLEFRVGSRLPYSNTPKSAVHRYLIEIDNTIIVDVEASRAMRQEELSATRIMVQRTRNTIGFSPEVHAAGQVYSVAEEYSRRVE